MFATLTGPWPRVLADGTPLAALEAGARGQDAAAIDTATETLVRASLTAQVGAGLEPLTDGQVRWPDLARAVAAALDGIVVGEDPGGSGRPRAASAPRHTRPILVSAWQAATSIAASVAREAAVPVPVVKQAVPGPYTLGMALDPGRLGRERLVLALADALADELVALAEAGCAIVEVEEPAAVRIGSDAASRALFLESQRRLLAGAPELHATLAITGGSADEADAETILGAPYRSFLFDLIGGPDNWRLVAAAPAERGIVCGALRLDGRGGDPAPLLAWAARYAAATNGRGTARVGLANAGSLAALTPAAAADRVQVLGRATWLAAMAPAEAIEAGLDPRAFDARTAALGTPRRPPRRPASPGR
jgi:hypothetical protein